MIVLSNIRRMLPSIDHLISNIFIINFTVDSLFCMFKNQTSLYWNVGNFEIV